MSTLHAPPFDRRRFGRRRFLTGSLGVLAAVTGGVWRTPYAPAVQAKPIDTDDGPLLAFLSSESVSQADSFSLRVDRAYADSGLATFNGLQYPLFPSGRYLVAIIGAGQGVADEVETEPGDYSVDVQTQSAAVGPLAFTLSVTVGPTDFPVDRIELPPDRAALLDPTLVAREVQRLEAAYGAATPQQLWQGVFRWPVQGPITTYFGQQRSYNGGPVSGHHSGVDIGVDEGVPVGAAAAGRVVFADRLSERGNMVIVDHGLGVYTGYAHLSAFVASPGDQVAPGSVIGLVGNTGLSTGPHLHWECAVNGLNVDASRWTTVLLP